MNKIMKDSIKVGDKFKGKINNEIFEIISIDYDKGYLMVKNKNKKIECAINCFKRLLLEKIIRVVERSDKQ